MSDKPSISAPEHRDTSFNPHKFDGRPDGLSSFLDQLHSQRKQDSKVESPAQIKTAPDLKHTEENSTLENKGHLPKFSIETPVKIRELHNLPHSVHDGKSADAMVVLPKNFDPSKPVNLMIYNHGWYDTASSSVRNARLTEQMKDAPPNTVMIVPEWQQKPGSHGPGASNQGKFAKENFASEMIQDSMDRTPELQGKKLADIKNISIVSHSAGYVPTESMLYYNPQLAKKVNSVTMLDSLYDGKGLNKWIHNNIADLSNGTKQFHNIFNQTTANNSREQAQFVARELAAYNGGRHKNAELIDYSPRPLTADQLKAHSIVFKATAMPHMEIPKNLVGTVQQAAASKYRS